MFDFSSPALKLSKIALVIKSLFDGQTRTELDTMSAHFNDAYDAAQLCALAAVGIICRVFGLIPGDAGDGNGARGLPLNLFVQWLQSLDPMGRGRSFSPLDNIVEAGAQKVED